MSAARSILAVDGGEVWQETDIAFAGRGTRPGCGRGAAGVRCPADSNSTLPGPSSRRTARPAARAAAVSAEPVRRAGRRRGGGGA
ncbi:hypothetical protein ACFV6F_17045, partial [Kitasatospora phosalacinea]|uniref:hypothetical protein n=1 Tax=Kitasatospora phosalacinea TaxID=2065 RepID=UPI003663FA6F